VFFKYSGIIVESVGIGTCLGKDENSISFFWEERYYFKYA
jgi:hypothetical protein